MPSKFIETMNNGDTLIAEVPGGGGWGNPLERDPDLVMEDIISEKISIDRAQEIYGVVLNTLTRQIDRDATTRLRQKLWSSL